MRSSQDLLPGVVVLMATCRDDDPDHLREALQSICELQTRKPDQFVLVCDGPLSPRSEKVIGDWGAQAEQLVALSIVRLEENCGLAVALNTGLDRCEREYVVRMDADDLASADRIGRQLAFMESNPEIAASSGYVEELDSDGRVNGMRSLPSGGAELLRFAKRRNPLSHPATIFRLDVVRLAGGYPPLRKCQDYALWSRLLVCGYKLGNAPAVLLKMRAGHALLRRRGFRYFLAEVALMRYQRKIGFLNRREMLHNLLGRAVIRMSPDFMKVLFYRVLRERPVR